MNSSSSSSSSSNKTWSPKANTAQGIGVGKHRSILFAGKAIRVLRNPSPAVQSQGQLIQKGRLPLLKDFSLQTILAGGVELVPQAMLQNLKESSEFHKRTFEIAADSIKAIAANHLWQLVVVRADLTSIAT